MNRQHAVGDALRTGVLDGALRPRILGRAESVPGPSWLAVLIEEGRAWLSDEDDPIRGPALAWRPWHAQTRAKFAPGATGCYVLLGPPALAGAIGHLHEARELREFVDLQITRDLSIDASLFRTLRSAFHTLHDELGSDDPGSRAVVDAYLRIVLIAAYRAWLTQSGTSDVLPTSDRMFTQFSNLIERHFRERWTVNAYAARLGTSRDRLGDVCRRARSLGPKELIDRRVLLEARLQLEGSALSIQQIAGLLGFASAPQFTRFFHRRSGVTPGRYRRQAEERRAVGGTERAVHYEWP